MHTIPCSMWTRCSAPLFSLLALGGLGSSLVAQHAARARMYEVVLIQPAGSTQTSVTSVNARGQVTGTTSAITPGSGFVWRQSTGLVPLAPLAGLVLSSPNDVNRSGFVAGFSSDGSPQFSATVWTSSGSPFAIPLPGATSSVASALNDAGLIVGEARVAGHWNGWVWDAVHGVRDLGDFGLPVDCFPNDINEMDQIVGSQPLDEAFLLDLNSSTLTRLGTLGGDYSAALGLNDHGHVVGWALDSLALEEPFLWTPGGGMRSLGSLLPPGKGPALGRAYSVNDSDVVVGYSEVQALDRHAFVWDAANGMRDLNELVRGLGPYKLTVANHVSDNGWIAGNALDTSAGNTGVAFLLRPQ